MDVSLVMPAADSSAWATAAVCELVVLDPGLKHDGP